MGGLECTKMPIISTEFHCKYLYTHDGQNYQFRGWLWTHISRDKNLLMVFGAQWSVLELRHCPHDATSFQLQFHSHSCLTITMKGRWCAVHCTKSPRMTKLWSLRKPWSMMFSAGPQLFCGEVPELQKFNNCKLAKQFMSTTLICTNLIEGSLNSKLPTIWRVEKQMKSR